MKQTGRFLLLCFLVLLLVMSFGVTAFADGGNMTITAKVPCTVTMQIGDHGKVSVDSIDYTGNSSFKKAVDAVVIYTFKPDTLYAIDKVIYNGTDVTAELSGKAYTAPALDGSKTLQVSFRFLGIGEDTTYTVTFHANGHGTAPATQTIIEGNTATEPTAPTADGYTFGGWYKDAACTEAQKYLFSATVNSNLDLYAKWTKNSGGGDTPDTPDTPGDPADPIEYPMLEGATQTVEQGKEATFKSGADFAKFVKIMVDGAEVAVANYEVKEGSTVVTLKADYIKSLSVGVHTLAVVSNDGIATTTFTVKAVTVSGDDTPAQPGKTDDPTSIQTGDTSNIFLWIALMFVAGIGVVVTTVYGRKKRKVR